MEHRYLMNVCMQIEVQAFTPGDAREAVEEVFGDGVFGAIEVLSHEINDEEEL